MNDHENKKMELIIQTVEQVTANQEKWAKCKLRGLGLRREVFCKKSFSR